MTRKDICPSCGKTLRYVEEQGSGKWKCDRCKYSRWDGAERNPFKFLTRRKKVYK